jgi:hypothetical protein
MYIFLLKLATFYTKKFYSYFSTLQKRNHRAVFNEHHYRRFGVAFFYYLCFGAPKMGFYFYVGIQQRSRGAREVHLHVNRGFFGSRKFLVAAVDTKDNFAFIMGEKVYHIRIAQVRFLPDYGAVRKI